MDESKVAVPKFLAEWYESRKDTILGGLIDELEKVKMIKFIIGKEVAEADISIKEEMPMK